MVRINRNKIRKYVSWGLSCTAALWDFQKHQPRKNQPRKKLLEAIIAQKAATYHTKRMVAENKTVSPEALITAVENTKTTLQFLPCWDELLDRLVKAGKIGNANVYKATRRTLRHFKSKATLLFTAIDQRFLNKYEAYLRSKGLADTSLAVYFRTLRTVFSKAIKEKLGKAAYYPFKEFNISTFNTKTQKRAITKVEIKKIAKLPMAPDSPLDEPKQYFLFKLVRAGDQL